MAEPRAAKRVKLLDDEQSDQDNDASTTEGNLTINDEFARRFEHNKKREEFMKLEEKYGRGSRNNAPKSNSLAGDSEDSDSSSESEDEGVLATEAVDNEISATLRAIRSRDPRVYDKSYKFYAQEQQSTGYNPSNHRPKPLTLQDYHRQNLLNEQTHTGLADVSSQNQELDKEAWKQNLVQQIHDASFDDGSHVMEAEDEEFLQAKPRSEPAVSKSELPSVAEADKDPDAFLNSLMASRAWVPTERTELQPFESDDEQDEVKADEFEEAYNLRFEDPERANEKLWSHSRDAAAEQSVRREQIKGRKKAREVERARQEVEKRAREKEKQRLRNLRIEQAHEKLQQFKDVAGLTNQDLPVEEWSTFLDAAYDSDRWETEMQKRFGDGYYAVKNDTVVGDNGLGKSGYNKPKWTEDIDIDDIVPGFVNEDDNQFFLSENESLHTAGDVENHVKSDGKNEHQAEYLEPDKDLDNRTEDRKRTRKERRKIEEMVDSGLSMNILPNVNGKESAKGFRYRETSPVSFGLSSRDILLADDSALNQHHGLKKLAAFRDSARKAKDKKRLDKKRLRSWRKETFGNAQGPQTTLQDYVQSKLGNQPAASKPEMGLQVKQEPTSEVKSNKKKKKRKRPQRDQSRVVDEKD